jgi:hypothetical protein
MQLEEAFRQPHDRKSHRIPVRLPVQLRSCYRREPDYAYDLSSLGMGLATLAPVEPCLLVSLHLEVPNAAKPIDLLGRVIWATDERMGVRFLHDDARLSEYLQQLRTELRQPGN